MKKIVFTGGTHVGKTSVLEYLETQGFMRYISVAGSNMRMLHDLLGGKRYAEYRGENFYEFQIANLYDDLKLYHQNLDVKFTQDDTIFFDRGVFDWIASMKREGIIIPNSIEEIISKVHYDLVFIFDPIENHDPRNETARLLNRKISEKWAQFIETEYTNRGYKIIHVPDINGQNLVEKIKKRAEFVIHQLEKFEADGYSANSGEMLRVVDKQEMDNYSEFEISRSYLEEDLPRENLKLRKITSFQTLDGNQIKNIDSLLQDLIQNMKYNSFEKIDKLFASYFKKKDSVQGYTLLDAYNELDFGQIDIKEGSNCVGMCLELQKRINNEGIDAKIIRFDAGGLINNDYVVNGHCALVVPLISDGKKSFILVDPGLIISHSIKFELGDSSKTIKHGNNTYKILPEGINDLPYSFLVGEKIFLFDPGKEWLNPCETLNKDIMRALGDFKIVKQSIEGRPTLFKMDIESGIITLGTNEGKIDIGFKEFIEIDKNSKEYMLFEIIMDILGEKPDIFYPKIVKIIEHMDDYKSQIWSPSTREIINNQK